MSGIPPQIDTTQPGTPAGEWARSTTTAAFARTEPTPALSSHYTTSAQPASGGVSVLAADQAQKPPFDAKAYNMNPPTPGADLPGAYPATPGEHAAQPQLPVSPETVKKSAQTAAQTATTIVQSAATTAAQYLPQGVVDTVSSIIPTSSATTTMTEARASEHDAVHKTSFPTDEMTGASAGERTGGVGSLPGFVNESAVPKLPDERSDDERYITAGGAAAALAAGAYAVKDKVLGSAPSTQDAQAATETAKQKVQETAQNVKQAAPTIPGVTGASTTAVTASTVPSREPFGARPGDHSSGVGALPGDQDEPHVARLPEESANPQYDSGPIDTAAQVSLKPSQEATGNESATGDARHVGGVGALVGGRDESGVGVLPDERTQTHGTGTGSVTQPSSAPSADATSQHPKSGHHGQPNQGQGYDTDYHPAKLHPPTETYKDPASAGEKSLGATQADAQRSPEEAKPAHQARSPSPGEKAKKAGFMHKMKGEAKVLLGKIEGKHEKVEQGEKIKAGEA